MTLTNNNTVIQSNLGENNSENTLTEPSQVSNEIQVWTQIMEQQSNDRIEKMREEMDNQLEAILREIKTNKSSSTVTNPRSYANEMQGSQQSGSRIDKSIGVHASNNENSDYENDDFPPKVSKMKDLKHPADPLYQNESDVDVTILPDEESDAEEVEDYHRWFKPSETSSRRLDHGHFVLTAVSSFSISLFKIVIIVNKTLIIFHFLCQSPSHYVMISSTKNDPNFQKTTI